MLQIHRTLLLTVLFCSSIVATAQEDYKFYLEKSMEFLRDGNCEKAEALYNSYKDLTKEVNKDVELELKLCKGNLDYSEGVDQDLYIKARKGDSSAQYELGMFHKGKINMNNTNLEKQKCIYWFEKSAVQNNENALKALAEVMYNHEKTEIQNGISILERLDSLGSPDATYELGRQYIRGEFLPLNIEKGFALLENAANKGYVEACFLLGDYYSKGYDIITINLGKALDYLKIGCEQGDKECCSSYRELYLKTHQVKTQP